MTYKLHNCAADGCDKQIGTHLFMCFVHWRIVPRALQRALRAAWRKYGAALRRFEATHSGADRQESISAAHELTKTQEQAINAVREKVIKRALKNQQHGDNLDLEAPDRYAGETPRPD